MIAFVRDCMSSTLIQVSSSKFSKNYILLSAPLKSSLKSRFHRKGIRIYLQNWYFNFVCSLQFLDSDLNALPDTETTLRCQINESTRLLFFDFFPRPTCLFGPTCSHFPPYLIIFHSTRLFGPLVLLFNEIYLKYPSYSFILPYSFNWHLRVFILTKKF